MIKKENGKVSVLINRGNVVEAITTIAKCNLELARALKGVYVTIQNCNIESKGNGIIIDSFDGTVVTEEMDMELEDTEPNP